jgi:SAM-dependent methyltransferase
MTDLPDRPLIRTRLDEADLAAAWEANAASFIAWAQKPGHDSYWQFHRDLFLELVPKPGYRTLDLGCGEGRLSRDLARIGHQVIGVDLSATMLAAARAADPSIETHLADAASLPFDDSEFDVVVAFMSLQDVTDYAGAIREAGRVLVSGGSLCIAIVHPFSSAGRFEEETADSRFVVEGSYLEASFHSDRIARDGLEIEFVSEHRSLDAYCEAIAGAGLLIERLREPALPEHGVTRPHSRRWQRLPLFLHVRARKP